MFEFPLLEGYTIYTKSKCGYCTKAKEILPEDSHVINCDEYLKERRDAFLEMIDHASGQTPRTFPMVFLDGSFIGGHAETAKHLEELAAFIETDF